MPDIKTKAEIIEHLNRVKNECSDYCNNLSEALFFYQPEEKWSIAQNITHLITSANMTRLAYRLPKFIVRIYSGTPNRASRTYDEVIDKYKLKLQQGGKASGQFIAKPVAASLGKHQLMDSYNKSMEILITTINEKWKEDQLNKFLAPHPLLGKLTLRELCFFTIYHSEHHLNIIKSRLENTI